MSNIIWVFDGVFYLFFFFFSSRRRHTRSYGDWSSDVCSSDLMCDHKGVIYKGREGLDEFKQRFGGDTKARTLVEALQGADVFVGLSVAGIVTGDMLLGMAKRPVILAPANPTPEIMPDEAKKGRPDAIVATVGSDF